MINKGAATAHPAALGAGPAPVPGTGMRTMKARQAFALENSVFQIIMYHGGNGKQRTWGETDEEVSLEMVIFRLTFKDRIRVGHLKREGREGVQRA